MDWSEYQADVKRTHNPDVVGVNTLIMSALGMSGESGEIADMIKKHLYQHQQHGIDSMDVALELGDLLYYLTMAANWFGYGLQEVAELNVAKRAKRYPNGFDPEKSINRS